MTKLFVDLYAAVFALFIAKDREDGRRIRADAVCSTTVLIFVLSVILLFEYFTGRDPLGFAPSGKLAKYIIGVPTFLICILAMKIFVKRHPVLQSADKLLEHSSRLPLSRKKFLAVLVTANLVLFLALVVFVKNYHARF